MNERQQRGLVIAATQKLTQKGKVWLVPSQTGNGKKYTVCPDPETPFCSCPDHEETGGKCKHLYAVEFAMKREVAQDGTITETRTFTVTEKKVYRKPEWPLYNLCQVEEKRRFQVLLHDLCRNLPNAKPTGGRERTATSDVVFACVMKVYSCLSSRRFGTDLDEATEKGYVSRKMHPGMTWAFLKSRALTSILQDLIVRSSLPLAAIETSFAPDSTGFSTSRFAKWYDEKNGRVRSGKDWAKAHAICGTKTHIITAAVILDRDAADCPQFRPLVEKTAENFTIREVEADKAYLSRENLELVDSLGGVAYVPFKSNSVAGEPGSLWEKLYHYYSLNRETFLQKYHQRSNIESVFSMVKAKFGDAVRSRTQTAMRNEVYCKFIAHNICCVLMSQVELGIEPVFWAEQGTQKTVIEMPAPAAEEKQHFTLPRNCMCVGA
jgi:transposase/predicted nucleic acid-binding Zn finger protein